MHLPQTYRINITPFKMNIYQCGFSKSTVNKLVIFFYSIFYVKRFCFTCYATKIMLSYFNQIIIPFPLSDKKVNKVQKWYKEVQCRGERRQKLRTGLSRESSNEQKSETVTQLKIRNPYWKHNFRPKKVYSPTHFLFHVFIIYLLTYFSFNFS